MSAAHTFSDTYTWDDVQTDSFGTFIPVLHNLGKQYVTVSGYMDGEKGDTLVFGDIGSVVAADANTLKIYRSEFGGFLHVRVVA